MICPVCHTHIPDDAQVCPACHARLTQEPASTEPQPPAPARELPHVESALSEVGKEEVDDTPRVRPLLLAAGAAAIVCAVLALVLVHPWDPDAYSTRATTPADTSHAGYPGSIDSLSGQDRGSAQNPQEESGPDTSTLAGAYRRLGELYDKLQASEEDLYTTGISGTSEERTKGSASMEQLSLDVSNLIDDMDQIEVSGSEEQASQEHLIQLGNWLRNWSDALGEAWQRSTEVQDPSSAQDSITAPLAAEAQNGKTNRYAALFKENYARWAPPGAANS